MSSTRSSGEDFNTRDRGNICASLLCTPQSELVSSIRSSGEDLNTSDRGNICASMLCTHPSELVSSISSSGEDLNTRDRGNNCVGAALLARLNLCLAPEAVVRTSTTETEVEGTSV